MKDTVVTIQGKLVTDVTDRTTQSGVPMATFRIATAPRRPGRARGEWVEGPMSVYSVACWRALATHVTQSLENGTPVIVQGRLTLRTFSRQVGLDTVPSVTADIDAFSVGPDLTQGTAAFQPAMPASVRAAQARARREAMTAHPAGSALQTPAAIRPVDLPDQQSGAA